jgi:chemotaxis protein MotB
MRRHTKNDHEVIVKRRSRKTQEETGSGAWKVAFADFTLAMMALFMVLWIVQPQNKAMTKAGDMESNPLVDGGSGIFDGNSRTPLDLDGVPVHINAREERGNEALTPNSVSDPTAETYGKHRTAFNMKELANLMQALALQLDATANLQIQVVPQGLRILIKDDQQRFMFERGSTELNVHFKTLLSRLAVILAQVDNKLIISGHTDATPYAPAADYNNWNLSGDRALRARNVLVAAGLPASAVLQVTAQADGTPLRPQAPNDGANRRIEILLLTTQAESLYRELFGDRQTRVNYAADGVDIVAPGGSGSVDGEEAAKKAAKKKDAAGLL